MNHEKSPRPFSAKDSTPKCGRLFIISAPSGAGKSTLCKALLKRFGNILFSISHKTRTPRPGEQDGVDYFFITQAEFEKGIKGGKWAEWAVVHENYYGTSTEYLDKELMSGKDILLEIDVQGARQILEKYPESITIFIMAPSFDELRNRLESRGTDDPDVIERRMKNAKQEVSQKDLYRHIIVNDNLSRAQDEFLSIIERYSSSG
jgi:guanylate kinase